MKKVIWLLVVVVAAGAGYYFYQSYREAERNGNAHLVSGNGRLEATEVSIATKLAGRIETIMVNEGDFVTEGQKLALMQTNVLEAQLEQAKAQRRQAVTAEASAKAMVEVRVSELEAAKAGVLQKESTLDGARKRYERLRLPSCCLMLWKVGSLGGRRCWRRRWPGLSRRRGRSGGP